jgi:hypothetical protein
MDTIWFFEDVNLFDILCPHKFKAYKQNHDFDAYKKQDYIYLLEEAYAKAKERDLRNIERRRDDGTPA